MSHLYNIPIRLFFTLFFVLSFGLQSKASLLTSFTSDEGLSSNQTYSIVEDRNHFIWVLNKYNVQRFDGKRFKKYTVPVKYFSSLDKIQLLNDGRLCLIANKQFYVYNEELDKFELFEAYKEKYGRVFSILTDKDDKLWVFAWQKAYIFEGNKLLKKLKLPLAGQNNTFIYKKDIYVSIKNKVFIFSEETGQFEIKLEAKDLNHITSFVVDKDLIIVGTRKTGVYFYKNGELVRRIPSNYSVKKISKLYKQYYVATDGGGVLVVNTKKVKRLSNESLNDFAYDVMVDSKQNIWCATYNRGINIFNRQNSVIEQLKLDVQSEEAGSLISSILTLNFKYIIGTEKGVSIYNIKDETWRHIVFDTENKNAKNVVISFALQGNTLWAARYGKGLYKVNLSTYKVEKYIDIEKELGVPSNDVKTILLDKNNTLWIGSVKHQLVQYFPEKNYHKIFPLKNINLILQRKNGELVVSSDSKMVILSKELSNLQSYEVYTKKNQTHELRGISDLFEDQYGTLWVASQSAGLLRLKDNVLIHRSFDTPHYSRRVCSIQEDNQRRIWLSTNDGLFYFEKKRQNLNNFSHQAIKNEFKVAVSSKNSLGTLAFGGYKSITIIHPDGIKKDDMKVNVYLDELMISERLVTPIDSDILSKKLNNTSEITVPYDQNFIDITFTAPHYEPFHSVYFQWKMDGVDKNWRKPTLARTASYSDLSEGNYTLHIRAVDENATPISEQRTLEITIKPPYWKSIYAYALYLSILSALAYGIYRYTKLVFKRRESLKKMSFFTRVAHDIKTPLSLIIAPLHDLIQRIDDAEQQKQLHLIEKNTRRILRLTDQLVNFESVSRESLRSESFDVIKLTKDAIETFEPLLDDKKLTIQFHSHEKQLNVALDKDKVDKVIYNLISNAVKYSKEETEITVSISKKGQIFELKVQDCGIGIPQKQQKYIFKEYYRADNAINSNVSGSGIGLMFCKKLVELMDGVIDFVSSEKGTTFTVTLPIILADVQQKEDVQESIVENQQSTYSHLTKGGTKRHLLLVEDNTELRSYLRQELSKHFYITEAANGEEALAKLEEKEGIEMVLSDFMMPRMGGLELCSKIREHEKLSDTIFILITAVNDEAVKIQGYQVGVDAYLEKPFNIDGLKARMERLFKKQEKFKREISLLMEKAYTKQAEEEEEKPVQKPQDEFLNTVLEHINENINDSGFSVSQLCDTVGMSHPAFYRKMKKVTGYSPKEFIDLIRINRAKNLLVTGMHTISEVAYDVGFSDPKYFSTVFKKHVGITPSGYIKQESQKS